MGRIYKDIGFRGLWNGLPVRIVMIGTVRILDASSASPFPTVRSRVARHARTCLELLNALLYLARKTC